MHRTLCVLSSGMGVLQGMTPRRLCQRPPASTASDAVRQVLVAHSNSGGIPLRRLKEKVAALTLTPTSSDTFWEATRPQCYLRADDTQSSGDDRVFFFDWQQELQNVAASLPFEGVLEKEFERRVRARCPDMADGIVSSLVWGSSPSAPQAAAGQQSLSEWISRHFSHVLLVTLSAASGEPIYYDQARNNVRHHCGAHADDDGSEVAALQSALHVLGRGAQQQQLPLWSDFSNVMPLLPPAVRPRDGHWKPFLAHPDVSSVFDVQHCVEVGWSGKDLDTCVIVDATSMSTETSTAMLEALSLPPSSSSAIKVMCRPSGANPFHGRSDVEVVRVPDLLDSSHVLGAVLDSLTSTASSSRHPTNGDTKDRSEGIRVFVLCGASSKEAFEEALKDVGHNEQAEVVLQTASDE